MSELLERLNNRIDRLEESISESSYTVKDVIDAAIKSIPGRREKYWDAYDNTLSKNGTAWPYADKKLQDLAYKENKDLATRVEKAIDKRDLLLVLIKDPTVPMDQVKRIAKQSIPKLAKKAKEAVQVCNTNAFRFPKGNYESYLQATNALNRLDRARFLAGEIDNFKTPSYGSAKVGRDLFTIGKTDAEAQQIMKRVIELHKNK